ncbi:hypothetical protein ACFL1C_02135 [Pseudomonadota bacterium]
MTVLVCLAFFNSLIANGQESWKSNLDILQVQSNNNFQILKTTHRQLVSRVKAENPPLLSRISLEPPEPRKTGYGLLPEIIESQPARTFKPKKTVYSIRLLEDWIYQFKDRVENLAMHLSEGEGVESLVSQFEASMLEYRHIENNLSYHEYWQSAIVEYREYFERRNRLLPVAQQLSELVAVGTDKSNAERLREEILKVIAPFHRSEGLELVQDEYDGFMLFVDVCTDIQDLKFMDLIGSTVEQAFSNHTGRQNDKFELEVRWQRIDPMELYDGNPPRSGDPVDERQHRKRFSDCPLVLTTGAADTHALVGDRVVLGTRPISPRVLTHEFAHLLGFSDAYLRGYSGKIGSEYGVEIIEWTGLTNDLMGRPGEGQVSSDMIDTLRNSY